MSYQSPLNIYVLWHPDFKDGKRYADLIYKTFNRDTEFALGRNLNIPVFYRYAPDPATNIPISIPYSEADCNVIVALLDDELFDSDGWEGYIEQEILEKIDNEPKNRLYPVAFSKKGASIAKDELSRLQFIRPDAIKNDDKEKEFQDRWRMIRSRLLHDFSRLLYELNSVGESEEQEKKEKAGYNARKSPPVSLFLSHAKKDGLSLAKELKRHIQDEHQMDTFFDANDIATSHRFDTQIIEQFDENTAVIAVLSDKYATREWCKLEVSMAKRKKCPLVVVLQIEKGEIRSFPYLGNVPTLLWNNNLQDIIDLILIQVLNARFSKRHLDKHIKLYGLKKEFQCMIYSNPPELFNYLDILAEDKKNEKKVGLVIYPDPPLAGEEQKILQEVMPDIIFTTPLQSYQFIK
jgi:TIR domain